MKVQCLIAALSGILAAAGVVAADSVIDLKVPADGRTDATRPLQELLSAGKTDLYFPAGEYRIGALSLPANTRLAFAPNAKLIVDPALISYTEEVEIAGKKRRVARKKPLFFATGDYVRIEGLHFDFSSGATEKDASPVETLFYAEGVNDPVISRVRVETSKLDTDNRRDSRTVFRALKCRNVVVENNGATGISHMLWADQCTNVTSRGNWQIGGASMTTFADGSENLRHHDNWSRQVGYQCVWRGGSPDPSRKAPKVPLGTANLAIRDVKPGDPNFIPHTQGAFDVMIQNNYAEYGTTLCWGNKGRQTIIDGNIARFMFDYSYGTEGGENVVFSNNISVNSAVAGFMAMYWSENLLVTGNLVLVKHEPYQMELTKRPESTYFGQFLRLHHGPSNQEDKYGAGTVQISGNLFVNELADRPSGISIEAGRDVTISGNKIINGLVRKHEELVRVRLGAKEPAAGDEFESQRAPATQPSGAGGSATQPVDRMERRVGQNLSRLTITGNEFISRQETDKACLIVNGTTAIAVVKDNIFRREKAIIAFTDKQREAEKAGAPRYMLYATDEVGLEHLGNGEITPAISVAPHSAAFSLLQGNCIYGWTKAIDAANVSTTGNSTIVIAGNTTDGAIATSGANERTTVKVEANLQLAPSGIPQVAGDLPQGASTQRAQPK